MLDLHDPGILDAENVNFKLSDEIARAGNEMAEDEDFSAELEEEEKVVFLENLQSVEFNLLDDNHNTFDLEQ